MDYRPSVGRIVHYVSYGTPGGEYTSECRAAIVTEVGDDDVVGLCVLNPTGQFFNRDCQHDEGDNLQLATSSGALDRQIQRRPAGGTWHWPERV